MNRSHGLYMQRSRAVHVEVTGCTTNFTCSQLHVFSSWIFAGGHQLRCDLVPPTACLVSCRRNTPDLRLYLRGTVKFVVSLSYKDLRSYLLPRYDSYVVFHGCNLKLVLLVLYSMHG
ncbi:unnamed protein product [Sphenostylis stenocarpa]|uniref:Uncharacterized protein n=1 Tax=Sphenostylis stenocarpa TaxID=92480 RepID=A0AA86VLZ7_9FABA|nr:unnamed protein product [Sphenostylis stenocarpa]